MSYCYDPMFSMNMDIYYSTESQDRFGKETKEWMLDRTILGYAELLGAVEIDSIKNNQFYEYENKLIGRSKEDPRVSLQGINYPISSILITNIVDAKTGLNFYTESAGERSGEPTLFDVMAVEPYVNPWNEIEYYKILFARSDKQVLTDG